MTLADKAKPQHMWQSRLASILTTRENASSNPARWRRTRAELRRGNAPATEHYAYPHVLPYVDPSFSDSQKTTLVRLFALVAEFDSIPQFHTSEKTESGNRKTAQRRSFGQWAHLVSVSVAKKKGEAFVANPENLDSIGQRLQFLYSLDAEEAILNVARIMTIASSLPGPIPSLDYFDLFRTFLYWGKGFTPESQNQRRRILRDYFSYYAETSEIGDPHNRFIS